MHTTGFPGCQIWLRILPETLKPHTNKLACGFPTTHSEEGHVEDERDREEYPEAREAKVCKA